MPDSCGVTDDNGYTLSVGQQDFLAAQQVMVDDARLGIYLWHWQCLGRCLLPTVLVYKACHGLEDGLAGLA